MKNAKYRNGCEEADQVLIVNNRIGVIWELLKEHNQLLQDAGQSIKAKRAGADTTKKEV